MKKPTIDLNFEDKLLFTTKKSVTFSIPGDAVGQPRPRFTTRHGYSMAYEPKRFSNIKDFIRGIVMEAVSKQGWTKLGATVPVAVKIVEYTSIPKDFFVFEKGCAWAGYSAPIKKPDVDNVLKILLDSFTGILFEDDKQVFSCQFLKVFCNEEHPHPETIVEVTQYLSSMGEQKENGKIVYDSRREAIKKHCDKKIEFYGGF